MAKGLMRKRTSYLVLFLSIGSDNGDEALRTNLIKQQSSHRQPSSYLKNANAKSVERKGASGPVVA